MIVFVWEFCSLCFWIGILSQKKLLGILHNHSLNTFRSENSLWNVQVSLPAHVNKSTLNFYVYYAAALFFLAFILILLRSQDIMQKLFLQKILYFLITVWSLCVFLILGASFKDNV